MRASGRRALSFAVLALTLGGCTLLASLENHEPSTVAADANAAVDAGDGPLGEVDAAGRDGARVGDASLPDARPPETCALGDATFDFCETFDGVREDAGFAPSWSEVSLNGGTVQRDTTTSRSAPQSLRSVAPVLVGDGTFAYSKGSLLRKFFGPKPHVVVAFDLRPRSIDSFPADASTGGLYRAYLATITYERASAPALLVSVIGTATVGDGGVDQFATEVFVVVGTTYAATIPLAGSSTLGSWSRITIDIRLAPLTVDVQVDGKPAGSLAPSGISIQAVDVLDLEIGTTSGSTGGGNGRWMANYDNVGAVFP